ncbi:MAG: hypothetical protein ACRC26_00275 [Bacteroidales bacterium]
MGDIFRFIFIVLIGGLISYLIIKAITAEMLKEKALEKNRSAFKIEILKRKEDSVHVGIFDSEDNHLENMCVEGEKFSDEIYEGNIIYI